MKKLLILGAKLNQLPLIKKAKTLGFRVVAIDPDPASVGFEYTDRSYVSDLADSNRCLSIAMQEKIHGVVTAAADFPIPTAALICETLHLPGLTVDAAIKATNKEAMRAAFVTAEVPSPQSRSVSSIDEAIKAVADLNPTAVIKPKMSSGGRGVTVLSADSTPDEISDAYQRAAIVSNKAEVLIEEFVEGDEFSVEIMVCNGQCNVIALTDKRTSGKPYFVEIGHSQPSQLSRQSAAKIEGVAVQATLALGVDNSPVHAEVKLGPKGPSVIEVGARLGGGFIASHLVPLSTGVDMVKAAINVALGREPSFEMTKNRGAAIQFLRPAPGVVKDIKGVKNALSIDGVKNINIYLNKGEEVRPLTDATARVGHIIADGENAINAMATAEKANSLISFITC